MLQEEKRPIEELIAKALTLAEQGTLSRGRRLTFRIDNVSFYPEEERRALAEALEHSLPGSSQMWSHLNVRGTAQLLKTGRTYPDYRVDLDITSLIPRLGKSEDYERSNLRPRSLSPRSLEIARVVSGATNLGGKMLPQPSISFYTQGRNGERWSIDCYRASQEE